jgi:hypothetical protein
MTTPTQIDTTAITAQITRLTATAITEQALLAAVARRFLDLSRSEFAATLKDATAQAERLATALMTTKPSALQDWNPTERQLACALLLSRADKLPKGDQLKLKLLKAAKQILDNPSRIARGPSRNCSETCSGSSGPWRRTTRPRRSAVPTT